MYVTIADWRIYATARGNSAPTDASDADATAALTRASDYIRVRYVANLLADYSVTFQPTGYDYPLVEEASYIAASLELATPGLFAKTYTPAEQKVLTAVNGIKWSVIGEQNGNRSAMPVSTLIDEMFEPYISDMTAPFYSLRSIGGACG